MPKIKTRRGAQKRFRVTKSGKLKRSKAYKRHILTKKNSRRKRNLRSGAYVSKADIKRIKKLLPTSI